MMNQPTEIGSNHPVNQLVQYLTYQQEHYQQQGLLPVHFKCRRNTVASFAAIHLFYVALDFFIIGGLAVPHFGLGNKGSAEERRVFIIILLTLSALEWISALIGLIGAVKEDYCLSMSYALLNLFNLTASIIRVAYERFVGLFWLAPVFLLTLTIFSCFFVRDLMQIRQQQQRQRHEKSSDLTICV